MKESKEYKGFYFSKNINTSNKKNGNKLIRQALTKAFFENGAHFKYSSLYSELQKLFKIQNYSLPKKKLKKKKEFPKRENGLKCKEILNDKIQQIKNKNKHNKEGKKINNKNTHSIKNFSFNKEKLIKDNTKLKTITFDKKIKNFEYSSFNSDKNSLNNNYYEDMINKKNYNKSKIFHIILNIKKKSGNNKYNKNDNFYNIENKQYSSSFVKTIPVFLYQKKKKLILNNDKLDNNKNKDIIKVNTKVLTPSNKTQKIKNKNKLFNIEKAKDKKNIFPINNSFIINRNKKKFEIVKKRTHN